MCFAWQSITLITDAQRWLKDLRARKNVLCSENSLWWSFVTDWPKCLHPWLESFEQGRYRFEPMSQYRFLDETVRVWQYADRLMIKLILGIIKPVIKHIISPRCYHLQGQSGVKTAIRHIKNSLVASDYRYIIRTDIRGYYESISRKLLTQQLHRHFQDPRLQNYFEQIVNCVVDRGGDVFNPTFGIPRRSSLSPFFGALYLSSLDQALQNRNGIQYFRYMDDILILAQTRHQYRRAKKILFQILHDLKLEVSPKKTRMGLIGDGFHFLGGLFEVPRSPQDKSQVSVQIHPRSCARALDKINAMRKNAVHPATMQRYLIRWASWWSDTLMSAAVMSLLYSWVLHTAARDPTAMWFGRGLLSRAFLTQLD